MYAERIAKAKKNEKTISRVWSMIFGIEWQRAKQRWCARCLNVLVWKQIFSSKVQLSGTLIHSWRNSRLKVDWLMDWFLFGGGIHFGKCHICWSLCKYFKIDGKKRNPCSPVNSTYSDSIWHSFDLQKHLFFFICFPTSYWFLFLFVVKSKKHISS